ncbi:hypothetical protein [Actinokineospora enzanensis]|uniref:hypothetical protein n=1 Tax=Actinokineospora enzanensis TaxID=155975 RepID=UPI000370E816|nr:hypothetical protein [Actinokineospora enzanensis]
MVRRPLPRAAAALVLPPFVIATAITGCEAPTDRDWSCSATRCELSITGSPTIEVLDARLKATVGRGQVRVAADGVDVTLNPGEAALVGGVRVELRAVDEDGRADLVVTE